KVANRVAVSLGDLTDCLDVVLVCEVEDEHVVCLSVYRLLNRVRLVCDEGGEQSNMPHSRNNIVPVSIPQVQVSFLSEEKRCLKPVRRENLGKLSKKNPDKYPTDELALILQIDHQDSAPLNGVENPLLGQGVRVVKQSGFHQDLQPRSQCLSDAVMTTPRLNRLDHCRESQISPSFKILPNGREDFRRCCGQIESVTQDPCYRSKPQFGH